MTPRVREILSWYGADNPGVLANLARMLNHGTLAGTGKMVILPVDQGFEHGPARSFAPNPPGYNPFYHFQLAVDAGLNAYAAPLGFLEAGAAEYAGDIPMILKVNNHDVLAEAKSVGLAVVVWSYPRGGDLSKQGETALDVDAYAAQIACQLGAHIVKVKLPSDYLEQAEAKKVYEKYGIARATLTERVRHIVQSSFDGRRIVIFSGGAKSGDEQVFDEVRAIRDGGGFGSIMGRNAFQRAPEDALKFLGTIVKMYAGEIA